MLHCHHELCQSPSHQIYGVHGQLLRCDPAKGEIYASAKKLGQELLDNCQGIVVQLPLYKDSKLLFQGMNPISLLVAFPTAPHTEIAEKGEVIYSEANRENVCNLEA